MAGARPLPILTVGAERATRRAVTQLNQFGHTVPLNLRKRASRPTNRQADDPLSMTRSVPTTAPAAGEAR